MAHGTQQDSTSSVGLLSDWDPTSSMTEPSGDQPPAYNADSIPLRDVSSDINHTTYPLSDQFVRLRLHETLSFERFQRISRLKDIQKAEKLNLY